MSKLVYTPIDDIPQIHQKLSSGFRSGKTKSIEYRKQQLLQLLYLVEDNQECIREALFDDLGRPHEETDLSELNSFYVEVLDAYHNLEKWVATERALFHPQWFSSSPAIRKEPKGVVLIIAPFNYPLLLILSPLVSAVAAGCAALVKPSELTPAVSSLLAELLPKYLDPEMYSLVNGSVPEMTKILELPWDHIMYTGSNRVAKIVSAAAAKHLTPLTLELGGKNPVVVDSRCDLITAARRILWGKVVNAGQVCLSPDYVLVPEHFQNTFVDALRCVYKEFFPTGPHPGEMARIINSSHVYRLKELLENTKGEVVFGGVVDEGERFLGPTVVKDVTTDDSLMNEELFGPILPIVPVKDVDAAISFINAREHPLALYVFTQDPTFKAKVFDNTQSGSAIANEVVIHLTVHGLPFGGIGSSGMGYNTGKYGFEAFTHLRGTIDNPSWIDNLVMHRRYPPYNRGLIQRLNRMLALMRRIPPRHGADRSLMQRWGVWFLFALTLLMGKLYWRRTQKLLR